MNIIIIGAGKTGEELIASLLAEDHDIAVIDPLYSVIENIQESYDVLGICGSGVVTETLGEAGAADADLVIACTPQDEINVLSCVISKRLGAKSCIARVRNPELNAQTHFMRRELGIDTMMNPDYYAAHAISRILRIPSASKVDSFAGGRLDMVQLKVASDSPLVGRALFQLPSVCKTRVLICAVQRSGGTDAIVPSAAYVIQAGDILGLTATHADIHNFLREIGALSEPIRDVLLVGGSRIAYYLAKTLLESGMHVKIIEQNQSRCVELSRELPKARIICGDGTDHELLIEEGVRDMDACIALTGMDEGNIILSLYASSEGVGKVIPKINKTALITMSSHVGLDSTISPELLTADMIVSYVRAMGQSGGESAIQTLYKLLDGQIEAMEFVVQEESASVIGIPLSQMKLKKNLLIAGIVRGSQVIYPGANDQFHAGDIVIVVTSNLHLSALSEILAE